MTDTQGVGVVMGTLALTASAVLGWAWWWDRRKRWNREQRRRTSR